ncbi:MAG: LPS export ABC transporter periplasmic protein LptC [Cytophagaceae bacterium]|nr:LPS export ABC transporter periplasmic protein LptC [Cytophagaceae bacterium]MBL0303191.1 LPS export ABC transporter periplasmic protein LptC [Cytophagaceae bacterium]
MKNLIFYFLLLVLIWPAFSGCEKKEKEQEFIEYTGPILNTDNLAVTFSDSGRVKVKMSTAKQLKFQNEDEQYPKAVYVNFLDKNGVEYSMLRGDSGSYSKSKNLYTITGNVFFNNRLLQQSLATEELIWNPVTKKIYSNKKVTIKTPRENITAFGGMEASEDFSNYTFRKPKGTMLVDSLRTIVDTTEQK